MKKAININVNGTAHEDEVEPRMLLVHYLRDVLGLTGTHVGCETSLCGACTVLVDGQAIKSCTMFTVQSDGASVTTIEGLAGNGELRGVRISLFQMPAVILTPTEVGEGRLRGVALLVHLLRRAFAGQMGEQGAHRRAGELALQLGQGGHLPARFGQAARESPVGVARMGVERGAPPGRVGEAARDFKASVPGGVRQHGVDDDRGWGWGGRRAHRCPEGLQRHPWIERMLPVVAPEHLRQPRRLGGHRVSGDDRVAQR